MAGLDLQHIAGDPVGFGDLVPAAAELATNGVEHFLGGEVAHGPFHHTGGRSSEQEHDLVGVKHLLELGSDFGLERGVFLGPVADHRLRLSLQNLIADMGWTGDKELLVHRAIPPY
ncbi:MAG: hypothetical protein GTN71_15660 [Anaerolineae bacterium]|nr:hypothetical protein [Anaerolineae bacterium]